MQRAMGHEPPARLATPVLRRPRSGALRIACVVVACGCSFARAGTIRDDRAAASYLSLGNSSRFAAVGIVSEETPTGSVISAGTLIAPNVVLTAAHAIDRATALRFQIGGASYAASRWLTNPHWNGDLAAGFDLGLFLLNTPVVNVTPARRYSGSAELGSTATFVGFGRTGTGVTGATRYDGLKRAGTNVLDALYQDSKPNPRILASDFDHPRKPSDNALGSPLPTALEFLTARGDSGGGVFIESPLGPRLAGVISFGYERDGLNNADYGDLMGSIRVSAFNSWIDEVMRTFPAGGGVAGQGGGRLTPNALEFATVPEPASAWLAVAALLGLAAVRRWR